jgi:asparagine synthase (glutamine-hydrolysing)
MCGIAGLYGRFEEKQLQAMVSALAHRGPDGEGIEILNGLREPERVGLGHRRLSLIDLTGGHQPMWSCDGSLAIVFNGEIYNYRELRQELVDEGAQFGTASDTEVILEGWRLRGARLLQALRGMFAFGMWDVRTREWILARDRAGIKPLYVAHPRAGELAFASEIKPLLPVLPDLRLHGRALADFLLYSWVSGPQTMFDGISHLPPGHVARWAPGDTGLKSVPFQERCPKVIHSGWKQAVSDLRDKLDSAVTSHMVADTPVGINLSGGLDSSAVLASMARLRAPNSIDSFTIGFGLKDDETPFARRMASYLGVRHHVCEVSPDRVSEDFACIIRTLEEPIAHPVLQTTLAAASLARERVKAVLIGEGSDEIFLGYPQYLFMDWPLRHLPHSVVQRLYLGVSCLMPTETQLRVMLDPALDRNNEIEASAHRFDHYFNGTDIVEGMQAFELEHPLVANQLMRIDKLTMAKGLEARVPFLDNDLVDFAFALPVRFKRWMGGTKVILRHAMAERLPAQILRRPKTGKRGTQALLPFLNRLVSQGPLAELISPVSLRRRGWLRAETVLRYLAEAKDGVVRNNPIELRRRMKFAYALAVLEQWAREYLD